MDRLVMAGASITAMGEKLKSLVHYAAAGSHSRTPNFFRENGANLKISNEGEQTPLHEAAAYAT